MSFQSGSFSSNSPNLQYLYCIRPCRLPWYSRSRSPSRSHIQIVMVSLLLLVQIDDLFRREASSSPSRSRSRGTRGSEREQVSSLFEFCKSSMTTSESDSEEESFHSPLWWSWLSIACKKCYKNIILPSRKLLC